MTQALLIDVFTWLILGYFVAMNTGYAGPIRQRIKQTARQCIDCCLPIAGTELHA